MNVTQFSLVRRSCEVREALLVCNCMATDAYRQGRNMKCTFYPLRFMHKVKRPLAVKCNIQGTASSGNNIAFSQEQDQDQQFWPHPLYQACSMVAFAVGLL